MSSPFVLRSEEDLTPLVKTSAQRNAERDAELEAQGPEEVDVPTLIREGSVTPTQTSFNFDRGLLPMEFLVASRDTSITVLNELRSERNGMYQRLLDLEASQIQHLNNHDRPNLHTNVKIERLHKTLDQGMAQIFYLSHQIDQIETQLTGFRTTEFVDS